MAARDEFKITAEEFSKLHGYILPDETVQRLALSLESGMLVVFPSLENAPTYNINELNWSERYGITTASQFQLYLQALYTVSYLTRAYELDGDKSHLELAKRFVESWMEYNSDPFNAQMNAMLWNGHCAALRSENLIYFALNASEAGVIDRPFRQKLISILKEHGRFLADYRNYRPLNSQGSYQNKALLYVSITVEAKESDDWYKCAKDRIEKQLEYCFTDEGVHIENSYMYQLTAVRLFRETAEIFLFCNDSAGDALKEKIARSARFLAFMLKPDLRMPMIGDTKNLMIPAKDYEGRMDEFEYAATGGRVGEEPGETSAVFPKAGYFTAREFWDPQNGLTTGESFSDAVWTAFRAGCLTTVHKHADDLSFMLYAKGNDVFVDCGFYSYDTKSIHRKTLSSALSHNTVIVDGKGYDPRVTNPAGVGICDYVLSHPNGYDYVCGFNNLYENVSIDRHFYYFGAAILIFDDIRSESEHTYTQLFHLGENMKIVKSEDESLLMKIGKTGWFVRIRQLSRQVKLRSGYPAKSKISRKTNSFTNIQSLAFDLKGVNTSFVTLITIENKYAETPGLKSYDYDHFRRVFSFIKDERAQEIRLVGSKRLSKLFVSYTRDDNEFDFTASAGIKGVKYAWYVYERLAGGAWKLIDKRPYTANGRFLYRFEEGSKYRVKVFACTESGEQISEIAANISAGDLVVLPQINVTYTVEGNQFSFTNHAEQAGLLYAWYVSRSNGGNWESVHKGAYTDDNKFRFSFEKGYKYRVKAFILGDTGARRDEIVAEIEL